MDKGKPKVSKSTPTQNRNSVRGQGNANQQNNQRAPQQKKTQPKLNNPKNSPPPPPADLRPPLQRQHASKPKTSLRQPQSLEPKTPPAASEPKKSVDVRVTENVLEEQQPGMALLTPHGRYRHHARVVAYIDIVASIIHMIYIVISIGLMFNVDTFTNDVLLMCTIIFGSLAIIFIFFEVCISGGLLKSTDPHLNRYDATEKAGCWRGYEFFMAAFYVVYGGLSIYAGFEISGGFALVLFIMRCVGIVIVFQFIRDLDRQVDQVVVLESLIQAKKHKNHALLEVVSGMPNAY